MTSLLGGWKQQSGSAESLQTEGRETATHKKGVPLYTVRLKAEGPCPQMHIQNKSL